MMHGHGDETIRSLKANFSSNVWYGAQNSALFTHLSTVLPEICRYPEVDAYSLKKLLAIQFNIDTQQLLVCNGSTEAFYLIASAYAGSTSLIVVPTFAEYADACAMNRHCVYQFKRDEFKSEIKKICPDLIWLCNPNNPDGYCYSKTEIIDLCTLHPTIVFIIDQAYVDFTTVECNLISELKNIPNLIIVGSLTKRYAIPGLRLGYVASCNVLMNRIGKYSMPWSVNSLAIEAGKYLLTSTTDNFNLIQWLQSSEKLQRQIGRMQCFRVISSFTPFFLVELKIGNAAELKVFLLKNEILVRDAGNFYGLEGEYIRLCALSESLNNLLITKLLQWNYMHCQ